MKTVKKIMVITGVVVLFLMMSVLAYAATTNQTPSEIMEHVVGRGHHYRMFLKSSPKTEDSTFVNQRQEHFKSQLVVIKAMITEGKISPEAGQELIAKIQANQLAFETNPPGINRRGHCQRWRLTTDPQD